MNTSPITLPAATPLASLEVHAELVMLDLKKHVILNDAGIEHITLRMTSWDQTGQLKRFLEEVVPAFR